MTSFITGFSISLSLIVAIGAQNAFVLKQGLKGQYVFTIVMICALSDAVLIALGVSGFNWLTGIFTWLETFARYAGALFLLIYGGISFHSALFRQHTLDPAESANSLGYRQAIMICLGFTWLNPHVYLDTLMLLGAVSSSYTGSKTEFALGAISASFVFFLALGYGAALLRPVFHRPLSWKILDSLIGVVMWSICVSLTVME
jgi:L-lysine exporter family protein LysE/ArgO